jgi:hypothetical protein
MFVINSHIQHAGIITITLITNFTYLAPMVLLVITKRSPLTHPKLSLVLLLPHIRSCVFHENIIHCTKLKNQVLVYLPIACGSHSFVKTAQLVLKLKWCGGHFNSLLPSKKIKSKLLR